jgi:hypothetical protein
MRPFCIGGLWSIGVFFPFWYVAPRKIWKHYIYQGNVEIFHFGEWGSVCDDEFDESEARYKSDRMDSNPAQVLWLVGSGVNVMNTIFGGKKDWRFLNNHCHDKMFAKIM